MAQPFTRQSTLLELSRTPIGRVIRKLVALQAKSAAKNATEARLFAGASGYLTLEKIVVISGGSLPWPVADAIVDVANGRWWQVSRTAMTAGRDTALSAQARKGETPMTKVDTKYGPWALVAGASDGVGAAFAETIARSGINVVLLARRQTVLDDVAAGTRQRYGVETRTLTVDLTAPDASDTVCATTADLDIGLLVYCAGGDPDYTEFLANDLVAAERMVQRNCVVPMQLAHHYGRAMVDRGRGGIVILSSGAAFVGAANMVAYGATKAFDMIFAEALWSELKEHGVDALGVVLGETDTPSLRKIRHERGLAGPDEPVAKAATADEVVRDAFAMLGKGPTCMAGKQIRRGSRLINPIPRGALVRLMGWASRRQMGEANRDRS